MVPPYAMVYDFYLYDESTKLQSIGLKRKMQNALAPMGFSVRQEDNVGLFQFYMNGQDIATKFQLIEGSKSKIVVSIRISEERISVVVNDRLSKDETDFFREVRLVIESVLRSQYKIKNMELRQEISWFT